MASNESGRPHILLVGMGDLSTRVLTMLLADPATNHVTIAGRNAEQLRRRANLARFTAANLGVPGTIGSVRLDLSDVDSAAETIAAVDPDIIFMGASLQSWRVITGLPPAVFEELDEAQFGPWLPMHLVLNDRLMRAVRAAGSGAVVVNAAFPDAVGPVLDKVGLAPAIGVGNVANIVPALTYGAARQFGVPVTDVEVRLVAQHYFSHYVPRFGDAGAGSYHLSVEVAGADRSAELDHSELFAQLTGPLKRLGGLDGQLLTASSAVRVLRGIATDSGELAHAPSPEGLPGGYPVRLGRAGGEVALAESVALDKAILLNEECQRADGIEDIAEDGTVTFAEPEMAIMRRLLHYECRRMKLDDVEGWAGELGLKYREFASRFH